ncbi:MAG: glycosyltransferase family 39 protein [Sedimentisphaerales bacterium]
MRLLNKNKEILVLFLVALALRMFLALTARGIATDGCSYALLAKEIASGNFREVFSSILPPLFPAFAAGASYIFRDFELSGRIVSCLFGSLAVFPLFFLAKNIFDKKIALITVLFFVVHPYLSQVSGEVLTEALYCFLVTSIASLSWIAIQRRKMALFLVVGLLLSLAFLTRFEGFFLIFPVLGWIWLTNLLEIRTEIKWKFISSFSCLVMFIIPLSPYLFFVHQETGKWQLTTRQQQYEDAYFKSSTDERTPLQVTGSLLKFKIVQNIPQIPFCVAKAYYPAFLLPLFFGLVRRKRIKEFKVGEAYILSFILIRITELIIFAGIIVRYFYAFVPMALCWAGTGFWEIDYRLQEKYKDKNLCIGEDGISRYSVMILVVIMAVCLPIGLRPIEGHRAIQKEVGFWLRQNAGKKDFVIVASSPQESFYAGAKWQELKGSDYSDIINNARKTETDFVIVDKKTDDRHPDFRKSIKPEDLEVFTRKFEDSSRKIVIYKLKK